MAFLKEFRSFALRGNVMDMAVGVIIGGAFGKIVTSFINDLIMPLLGLLLGNMDFSRLTVQLSAVGADGKPVLWRYGAFITNLIDFALLALAVFVMVRAVNRLKKTAPPPLPSERKCPECALMIPVEAKRCGHCGMSIS
jgi:large conductance mechanosensitive channel